MNKDSLGDRMKMYESGMKTRLVSQIPVMGRLDGKAFHTFARQFQKPYDRQFHECMWDTAKYLCEHVQGVRLAYVQSDEITILLTQKTDYAQPWFDFELQKMCSVAASWASVAFLAALQKRFPGKEFQSLPAFDARFWNLPSHEVINAFIWRQNDAIRNSVQMLGQSYFSPAEMNGKDNQTVKDMLIDREGVNWFKCPTPQRQGVCIKKETYIHPGVEVKLKGGAFKFAEPTERTRWVVDENIPMFLDDRNYVDQHLAREAPEEKEKANVNLGAEG